MTKNRIPFNRPTISEQDQGFLADAIVSGRSSGNGPYTKMCERLLSEIIKVKRTLLTTSCTHALEMSALLCNLKPGDEVIVPAFTFVSTASAFALFGAKPVFVDSRSDTLNIDASLIERAISPRTRAICVVHYGGISCDMDEIVAIAERHHLMIVEDNAHGLFAKYKGRYLGTIGALATQSFHETKNITCGEGGALLLNDGSLIERAEVLREKGTDRARFLKGQVDKYTWVDVGSSWVLSDLLAAILWGQLQRVRGVNSRRVEIWNQYQINLADWADRHGVLRPVVPPTCEHVGHLYHLRFRVAEQRSRFIQHMSQAGVHCVFHYQALHTSPIGRSFGGSLGTCPVAEHASECLVRLPLFDTLTGSDQSRVIEAVTQFQP